jgi:single-stranded-DNA-specific exonuclease
MQSDAHWPAPSYTIAAARELLRGWGARGARVLVAPDKDVDGLAAAALTIRTLERLRAIPIPMLPGRGEHVHSPAMRDRLAAAHGDGLVVLDMGSRRGPIVQGLPTIVIDHHDAREVPDVTVFVSAAGHEPVAPTGLLAYLVMRELVSLDDVAWLAVLATVGDLGPRHPFAAELAGIDVKKTHLQKAVSLINAARRAPAYQPQLALHVLLAANGPDEIAKGTVAGVDALEDCRRAVQAEVERVARVPPLIAGNVALLRFSSPAQIHPLIATRWAPRLAPKIVIAANDGYLPGRINFAVRSASDVDLLAFLRGLGLGEVEGEFANGHPRATGGSVPAREFDRMLAALGYRPAS